MLLFVAFLSAINKLLIFFFLFVFIFYHITLCEIHTANYTEHTHIGYKFTFVHRICLFFLPWFHFFSSLMKTEDWRFCQWWWKHQATTMTQASNPICLMPKTDSICSCVGTFFRSAEETKNNDPYATFQELFMHVCEREREVERAEIGMLLSSSSQYL